jgi:hypothetical protein
MSTINHLFKRALHWLCIVVVLMLAACGPGTGGTGTGPQPVPAFAATYTSAPNSVSVTGTPVPDSCVSPATTRTFNLQLQPNSIELTSACEGYNYHGPWSVSATGEISVLGLYTNSSNGSSNAAQQVAVLSIVLSNASTDSNRLTLEIKTPSGVLLLGPVNLQRSSTCTPAMLGAGC